MGYSGPYATGLFGPSGMAFGPRSGEFVVRSTAAACSIPGNVARAIRGRTSVRMAVRRMTAGAPGTTRSSRPIRPGKALGDLRRARAVTQVELARRLAVSQATVSKFEKSNPAVSTVKRYVEALGGRLEMTAVFDDGRLVLEY